MASTHSDSTKGLRRRSRRPSSPEQVGAVLHAARARAGITLSDIHDRTGISWRQLEALEAGSLGAFPDDRSLLVALRRFADVVGMEADPLAEAVHRIRQAERVEPPAKEAVTDSGSPTVGAARLPITPAGGLASPDVTEPGEGGPPTAALQGPLTGSQADGLADTSPRPGAGSPVTAQVPSVASAANGGSAAAVVTSAAPTVTATSIIRGVSSTGYDPPTGVLPAVGPRPRRAPTPLPLRIVIWVVVVALAAGLAALGLHRVAGRWVRSARSFTSSIFGDTTTSVAHRGGTSPTHGAARPAAASTARRAPASRSLSAPRLSSTSATTATATIASTSYRVVVTDIHAAWISVSAPPGGRVLFTGILNAGQVKTFAPSAGRLAIDFGGAQLHVTVQEGTRAVPHWSFAPATVPFTLTFAGQGAGQG